MSIKLTRIFAYFTLATYLVVGTVAVRFPMPESVNVSFTTSYLNLFSETKTQQDFLTSEIPAPEMSFEEIIFPPKEIFIKKKPVVKKVVVKQSQPKVELKKVAYSHELPFYEPISLSKVNFQYELEENLVAYFKPLETSAPVLVAEAAEVKDEVSTAQASKNDVEADPTFFEYPTEEVAAAPAEPAAPKTETQVNGQIVSTVKKEIVEEKKAVDNFVDKAPEEVAVEELITFDSSSATQAVQQNKIPTVSKVATQKPKATYKPANAPKSQEQEYENQGFMGEDSKSLPAVSSHPAQMTIQLVGTDLQKNYPLNGFEVRFQDDLAESRGDYNQGSVTIKEELSTARMTRSVKILKHGFVPTNNDLVLEEGVTEVSIPMIEAETFNKLMEPHESRGVVGSILVELDDATELAQVDVPIGDVILLDGDFKKTTKDDFRYQLFLGVQAGNAVLSYQTTNGKRVSKIIHIHEREITFDSNFFEETTNEKISLYEEDLLSKEKSPLIVSGEEVKQFATMTTARKLNNNTYKINFGLNNLASRRYLELNHQAEPIFVGIRDNQEVDVPSESFMRYILSKFEGARLGNRCLIQVNLRKVATGLQVATESAGASLVTYQQALDTDGKLYDSLSEKTQKIIIVGENQGSPELSQEGKVNLKISYLDGSTQYLSSFCEPNSYLVEQL